MACLCLEEEKEEDNEEVSGERSPVVVVALNLPAVCGQRPAPNVGQSSAPSRGDDAMDVDYNGYYNNPTIQSVYDSDFTCSSSDALAPPTTDDDDEAADEGSTQLTDPEIIALIPPSFRRPPPPPVTHKWKCTECDYVIDLLNLTPRELDILAIPYDVRRRLRSKKWNMSKKGDEWAYEAFLHMVDKHHTEHLDERGIAFRRIPGGASVFLISSAACSDCKFILSTLHSGMTADVQSLLGCDKSKSTTDDNKTR